MKKNLLFMALTILLCGCSYHNVNVNQSKINASFLGFDVAEVNLPEEYSYTGTEKILIANRKFMFYAFSNGKSFFYFSVIDVDPDKFQFYDKELKKNAYKYEIDTDIMLRRNVPGQLSAVNSRDIVSWNSSLVTRTLLINSKYSFFIIIYAETIESNIGFYGLPTYLCDLKNEQRKSLDLFSLRAEKILLSSVKIK